MIRAARLFAFTLLASPLYAQNGEEASRKEKAPALFKVGMELPLENLPIASLDGKVTDLGRVLDGRVGVLVFHSMTCPYMVKGYAGEKKMAAMRKQFGEDVLILGINSNRTEHKDAEPEGVDKDGNPIPAYLTLRKHIRKNKLNFPVMIDSGNVLADRFQATATPHCYVIDEKGILRYAGAIDDDPRGKKDADDRIDYVEVAVDAVLTGTPITHTTTKAYGCSIKRVPKSEKKSAELNFREGSCCDRAAKRQSVCTHPCCKTAASKGKICVQCN